MLVKKYELEAEISMKTKVLDEARNSLANSQTTLSVLDDKIASAKRDLDSVLLKDRGK